MSLMYDAVLHNRHLSFSVWMCWATALLEYRSLLFFFSVLFRRLIFLEHFLEQHHCMERMIIMYSTINFHKLHWLILALQLD